VFDRKRTEFRRRTVVFDHRAGMFDQLLNSFSISARRRETRGGTGRGLVDRAAAPAARTAGRMIRRFGRCFGRLERRRERSRSGAMTPGRRSIGPGN
jgi:hypothetical protein